MPAVLTFEKQGGVTIQRNEGRLVTCDMVGIEGAGCEMVDALARLQLELRRHDATLILRNVSRDLRDLIELCGLTDTLRESP
jgi:anti-anti-sigma regulatory factor